MHAPSHFSFILCELAVVELVVEALFIQELLVVTLLEDVAIFHDEDYVGLTDGGKSVGYDKAGSALHHLIKGFLDTNFCAGIN